MLILHMERDWCQNKYYQAQDQGAVDFNTGKKSMTLQAIYTHNMCMHILTSDDVSRVFCFLSSVRALK